MKKLLLLILLVFCTSCEKSEGFSDPLNRIILGSWEYTSTLTVKAVIDFDSEETITVCKEDLITGEIQTAMGVYTVIDDKHINVSYFIDEEEEIRECTILYQGYLGSLKTIKLFNVPLFENKSILVNKL